MNSQLIPGPCRYSFPSSIEGGSREDLSGLWRSPGPDGSVSIPVDEYATLSSASSPEKILQASTSTANSSQLDFEKMKPTTKKVRLAPAYNPPTKGVLHYAPILRIFKPVWKGLSGRPRKQKTFATTNVPLEISMFLSGYVAEIMRRKTVESTLIGPTFTALNQLSDAYVLFLARLVSVI